MAYIKMIDTEGFGIHKMFVSQKDRYLPMPDYDKSDSDTVALTLPDTVIDENYSLLLLENSDIDLATTVLFDKEQKGKANTLSCETIKFLRSKKYIEGRRPKVYVSKQVAQVTDQKAPIKRSIPVHPEGPNTFLFLCACQNLLLKKIAIPAL